MKLLHIYIYIYIKLGIFWMFTWTLDVQIGHFLDKFFECLSKAKAFYKGWNLKIRLFCYIPLSFELCMHCLETSKIYSTKSVYSPKKALRIMNFAPFNAHTTPLFKNCNILKFADIINVESCIFINNCFNRDSFSIFNENFKLVSTTHSYSTRSARNGLLFVQSYNTDLGESQLSIQPLLHGIIFKTS